MIDVTFRQLYRVCNFAVINISNREQAPAEWYSNEGGIDPSPHIGRPDATRPGFRIHPRAIARNRVGCVTIVRGITAAYPEIILPGIVPRPGRTLYSSARGI